MLTIMVEGPDLVGKTTFVDQLTEVLAKKRLNHARVKASQPKPPDRDPFEEYEHTLDTLNLESVDIVVADRWHWGETVYGPIFRGLDRLEGAGWRHVELALLSHGTLAVYLHQPTEVLRARYLVRGDDFIQGRHLEQIQQGYEWCIRNTALPTLSLIDPSPYLAEVVVQTLLDLTDSGASCTADVFDSYVGSQRPLAILVGEQRGGDPDSGDRFAFTPRNSGAGRWLLEALPEHLWRQVGLANALEDDMADLWRFTGKPYLVALGETAAKELKQARLPHAAVPHPQYVRRFLHSHLESYGELIAKLIGTEQDCRGWRGTAT